MSPSRNEWPALESHYEDQYGSIDLEVYKTAGELWPAAKAFAEFALKDQDAGVDLMLQAAAKVTARMAGEGPPLQAIKPYLFQTYKHLVGKQKMQRISREQPLGDADDSPVIDIVADLERKILLRELFRRMSDRDRTLSLHLMFGYSYKEIAEKFGTTDDELRHRFSRLKRKLEQVVKRRTITHVK